MFSAATGGPVNATPMAVAMRSLRLGDTQTSQCGGRRLTERRKGEIKF
jgi:hypothetical protein